MITVKNPLEELKSTKLWIYLDSIDEDYANRSLIFVEMVSPLLASINKYFPYYTRHDAHHGFQVLKRMSEIINPNCLLSGTKLSFIAEEAFLLICSAYAHDLGMTVFPDEESNLLSTLKISKKKGWETNPVLQEHLRKNHSKRGGEYLNTHHDEIGLPKSLISHLNKLMMAHNFSINELDIELRGRYAAGSIEIDLKQLACILCIADSLEFSDTRVVDGVLSRLQEIIKGEEDRAAIISYQENMKHICIGDNVAISEKDGKIIFSGKFDDAETLSLAHRTIDLIENWVRDYCDIDYNSSKKRLKIRSDSVERTLDYDYHFERLGIRLKKENIINLISSNSLWSSDHAIVLRELLQNSVEACRYRRHYSSHADNYFPEIKVIFNSNNKTVRVSDNGCGMSRTIILNNFLTIGNSRSHDSSYTSKDFHSLARFGIGFWSVFTIAQKAHIITAPFEYLEHDNKSTVDGLEFEVSINEFRDYTVFKPITISPGTEIILTTNDDINYNNVISRLNYFIACSEIPIRIINDDEVYQFPPKVTLPTYEEIFGPKTQYAKSLGVKLYLFESNIQDIEFKLFFKYRQEEQATFLLTDKVNSVLQLTIMSSIRLESFISICGFKANFPVQNLCIDIDRIGGFVANNNNPAGINFNLSRRVIIPSEESEKMIEIITGQIYLAYKSFLQETNSNNTKTIYDLNQQSRMHGGNHFGINTKNRLKKYFNTIPELTCFKLYKIEKENSIHTCEVLYFNLNELINKDINIIAYSDAVMGHYRLPINQEKVDEFIYQCLSENITEGNIYYHERNMEASMIFENVIDSYIKIISIELDVNNVLGLPLLVMNPRNLNIESDYTCILGVVTSSIWSGSIYEKKIDGSKFVCIRQQLIIVHTGSEIASNFKTLFSNNQHYKIAKLVLLLQQAQQGFVDDSLSEFITL